MTDSKNLAWEPGLVAAFAKVAAASAPPPTPYTGIVTIPRAAGAATAGMECPQCARRHTQHLSSVFINSQTALEGGGVIPLQVR